MLSVNNGTTQVSVNVSPKIAPTKETRRLSPIKELPTKTPFDDTQSPVTQTVPQTEITTEDSKESLK